MGPERRLTGLLLEVPVIQRMYQRPPETPGQKQWLEVAMLPVQGAAAMFLDGPWPARALRNANKPVSS